MKPTNMELDQQKSQTLIISALLGAFAGLGVGYLLLKRAADNDGRPTLTAGEGVSLGLMVLGLLRQVAQLDEND
jgi:hypothetical protein